MSGACRADLVSEHGTHLLCDPGSHTRGRHPSRLSTAHDSTVCGPPCLVQVLRELCVARERPAPSEVSLSLSGKRAYLLGHVRVVFPQPVCPTTMTTGYFSTA